MQEYKIFIGGKWKTTAEPLCVTNPYNNEPIGQTYLASPSDVEEALESARSAFELMRKLSSFKRAEALSKIATGLREQRDQIAKMISLEAGKPIADARGEVNRSINTFQIASEEAKRINGETIPLDLVPGSENRWGLTRRAPIGPIMGITPFNFPLNLVAHKIAPAIASGNTILIKPAPKTPLTAILLAEIIATVGLPDGAVQIVPTTNELASLMVCDPRIKMLSFTGSAPVGWSLKQKANQKRVVLELGGNAGVIIHSDADIPHAVRRAVYGGFSYAGQTCISVQRIYLQEKVYQPFLDRFLPQVAALRMGDPLDEKTDLGPLITLQAAERVEGWLLEAVANGATILTGGKRTGALVTPTVIANATESMKVNCEEIFGPVVTVTPYGEIDEAITAVNRSSFGLQAGLFTRDMKEIFRAYDQLDVGGLMINDVSTYRADHMPYGGLKDSGFGREGVKYAMEEMTELKLLALNLQ